MKIFNNIMTVFFKLSFAWLVFMAVLMSPEVYFLVMYKCDISKYTRDIISIESYAYRVKKYDHELIITKQRDWRKY